MDYLALFAKVSPYLVVLSRLPIEEYLIRSRPVKLVDVTSTSKEDPVAPPPDSPHTLPHALIKSEPTTLIDRLPFPPDKETVSGVSQISAEGKACIPCLPPNSIVMSNPQTKEIQELKVSDRVLDRDGEYSIITEVMQRPYDGELVLISVPYQTEKITLTPEHPVLAIRANSCRGMPTKGGICFPGKDNPRCVDCELRRDYKPEWIVASDIKPNGAKKHYVKYIVLMPRLKAIKDVGEINIVNFLSTNYECVGGGLIKPHKANAHNRGRTAVPIKQFINIDSDFMTLVGYYLSEGSVTFQKRGCLLRFDFGRREYNLATEVSDLLQSVFGVTSTITEGKSTYRVSASSIILGEFFSNQFGKGSLNKNIPSWVLTLPVDKQKKLISSYWKGDGYRIRESYKGKEKNSVCYSATTVSRSLAYSLRIILHRIGIIHGLDKRKQVPSFMDGREIKGNGERYVVRVNGPSAIKLGNLIKQESCPWRFLQSHLAGIDENWIYLPVKKVERVKYIGTVMNLRTFPSETYTTSGVVVHNCGNDHFSTAASLLEEALRFAREDRPPGEGGIYHPEVVKRISMAEGQLNAFERGDGEAEQVLKLPHKEMVLMYEMLASSREMRHMLKEIVDMPSLMQTTADMQRINLDYRTRVFDMQLNKLPKKAREIIKRTARELVQSVGKEGEDG